MSNNGDDFPLEACKRFLEHQFGPDLVLPIYKFIDIPTPKTNAQLIECVDRWMDDPTAFVYHIGCWDTKNITDFSYVFDASRNVKMQLFDEVLKWDFSNAVNIERTFYGCKKFKGVGADQWDVSNVTNMGTTFCNCRKFNGDVSGWNVSNVTNMSHLFFFCQSFTCDLSGWEVSNVRNMFLMFWGCDALRREPIWCSRRRFH